jgi:hypothetical protein
MSTITAFADDGVHPNISYEIIEDVGSHILIRVTVSIGEGWQGLDDIPIPPQLGKFIVQNSSGEWVYDGVPWNRAQTGFTEMVFDFPFTENGEFVIVIMDNYNNWSSKTLVVDTIVPQPPTEDSYLTLPGSSLQSDVDVWIPEWADGYFDEHGVWHPWDPNDPNRPEGYYDEHGNWIPYVWDRNPGTGITGTSIILVGLSATVVAIIARRRKK